MLHSQHTHMAVFFPTFFSASSDFQKKMFSITVLKVWTITIWELLHGGFTVAMLERVILLTNQLIWLFILLNHRVVDFYILVLKFLSWQMLNNPSTKWISQHIGGGPESIPEKPHQMFILNPFVHLFIFPDNCEWCLLCKTQHNAGVLQVFVTVLLGCSHVIFRVLQCKS